MERTINETVEQEERNRDECRPVLDVEHLDSDKRGRREHYCCDGKANRVV